MSRANRRKFLHSSLGAGMAVAAAGFWTSQAPARSRGANEELTLGIIGIRGRGSALGPNFAKRDDCQVAYLAEVDQQWWGPRGKDIEAAGGRVPECVQDLRRVLDDRAVDAVVVATPDHWHALATVWACQAGKDVYVEKPASHTPWEGRKMVEAARKYDRIVQVGTQNRSASYNHAAKQYLDSGKLGSIHLVKVFNQKSWPNVKATPDSPTPSGLDWSTWLGPAPEVSYNSNHQNAWNHFWRYSGGDIINDGVHQIDLARWMIGRDYPNTVYCTGGRWAEDGVLETPDTQVAVFEYDELLMTFELSLYTPYMIKSDMELRNSRDMFPFWPQNAERIEIYGSEGLMYLGRHGCGWQVFGRPHARQPVLVAQEKGPFPDPEHQQNFVECVKSRKRPNADIEEGHRSTLLCQLANISLRCGGTKLAFDSKSETCVDAPEANALLRREYREPFVIRDQV